MRFALAVFGVALLHFFASFMVGFMAGTMGGAWRWLSNILSFPLSLIPPTWQEGNALLGSVIWGLTSVAWGWAICAAIRYFFRPALPN